MYVNICVVQPLSANHMVNIGILSSVLCMHLIVVIDAYEYIHIRQFYIHTIM